VLFPLHIATRGRLDGEYGIATRGYVICPDIVPRFPQDAVVGTDGFFARVTEQDLSALLRDFPKLTFEATAVGDGLYVCQLDGEKSELEAAVTALDLEGSVRSVGEMVAAVDGEQLDADTFSDRDIGDVSEEDDTATVVDLGDLVGGVEDEPPHC
jgi:hypothetical protein